MRRRKRRRRSNSPAEVELNMAAMLDMAFQLLAFFILTFRPSPIESQISLRMPDKAATASAGKESDSPTSEAPGLTLTVVVHATEAGEIAGLEVGPQTISTSQGIEETMGALRSTVKDALTQAEFEGISLQVSDDLNYERMTQVLDVCSHQTLPNGEPMTKISLESIK